MAFYYKYPVPCWSPLITVIATLQNSCTYYNESVIIKNQVTIFDKLHNTKKEYAYVNMHNASIFFTYAH